MRNLAEFEYYFHYFRQIVATRFIARQSGRRLKMPVMARGSLRQIR